MKIKTIILNLAALIIISAFTPLHAQVKLYDKHGKYLGNVNNNPYDPNSISNPYGKYGSPYSSESINNPYSRYGSPYSSESATNPYSYRSPRIYDKDGNYLGRYNSNKYDPESVSNPFSVYGSPYSPKSINNPYGEYGNPYNPNSVTYPYYYNSHRIFDDEDNNYEYDEDDK